MPEEQPLKTLIPLHLVLETKLVVFVGKFQEVEELGGCLHDRERRVGGVVNKDWNPTCEDIGIGPCRLERMRRKGSTYHSGQGEGTTPSSARWS